MLTFSDTSSQMLGVLVSGTFTPSWPWPESLRSAVKEKKLPETPVIICMHAILQLILHLVDKARSVNGK